MIGIYVITNKLNGKQYVGQSRDILTRWRRHNSSYNRIGDKEYDKKLYKAMRRHGIKNFEFDIIKFCSIDRLNEFELSAFNKLKPDYNTSGGFNSIYGYPLSEEHKKKISSGLVNSERYRSGISKRDFNGKNHPSWGMKRTKEQRDKMKNAQLKYFGSMSEEEKAARRKRVAETNIKKLGKKVMCIETGVIYPAAKEAARMMGATYPSSQISSVCNGKRKTAFGYTWKYV